MLYLADTANISEIKELINYFPITGVTTNPTILARERKPLSVIIPEIMEIIGERELHIQLISDKAQDMEKEALKYKEIFKPRKLFVKIPATMEGLKAIPLVRDNFISVTVTAIFTQQQALLAARAGADFVAPYVNRLIKNNGNGIALISDIVKSFHLYGLATKVLAASFKDADQVCKVSLTGCHAVTASYKVFKLLIEDQLTDKTVEDFKKDCLPTYDIRF